MTEPKLVVVEVVEHERVEGRGTARTHWLVKKGDGWVRVTEWAGAETALRDSSAGTVWERAFRISVLPGTELTRVEVRPRREPRRDPLAHLERGGAPHPKATRKTIYTVRRDGRLTPKK